MPHVQSPLPGGRGCWRIGFGLRFLRKCDSGPLLKVFWFRVNTIHVWTGGKE